MIRILSTARTADSLTLAERDGIARAVAKIESVGPRAHCRLVEVIPCQGLTIIRAYSGSAYSFIQVPA